MIAHIAIRIGLIVTGYVAAMVVSAIPVWVVTLFSGPASYYWTPEGHLVGPEYTALIVALIIMLFDPLLPALILILFAETFRWRRLWIYLIGWVLVLAVVTFSISLPFSPVGTTAANLSALLGGFIYWTIAGRQAGWPMKKVAP